MNRVVTQTFGTVGAVIEKDGKILLVKEAKPGKSDHGKWNIPEGWLDVGEDPIDGVKREVKEETGFTFSPTFILGLYSMVRKDQEQELGSSPHAIKIIFLGQISGKQSELHDDVSEIRWYSPEEIYSMGQEILRNSDIKKIVEDYFRGNHYPLETVRHTVQYSV